MSASEQEIYLVQYHHATGVEVIVGRTPAQLDSELQKIVRENLHQIHEDRRGEHPTELASKWDILTDGRERFEFLGARTVPYPDAALTLYLRNGRKIEVGQGDEHKYGGWVRVLDPRGNQLGYWTSEEWRLDPECVMGAFLACAALGHGGDT